MASVLFSESTYFMERFGLGDYVTEPCLVNLMKNNTSKEVNVAQLTIVAAYPIDGVFRLSLLTLKGSKKFGNSRLT